MKKNQIKKSAMSRDETMAAMYVAGKTLQEIGDAYGVTRERVRQVLSQQDVSRRKPLDQARRAHDASVESNRETILRLFQKTRNVKETVALLSGGIPARVVREVLEPVAHTQVLTRKGSEKDFSNDQITEAILEAEQLGFTSVISYGTWREAQAKKGRRVPSVATITVRYGSWSSARRRAGAHVVTERMSPSCQVFTDDQIQESLNRFVSAVVSVGSTPTTRRYDEWSRKVGGVPLLSTVRARTGKSWSSLTREALTKYS
jgi:hypothetical protein